jgi:hypothetical protein
MDDFQRVDESLESDPMATLSEDEYDRQWRSEVKQKLDAMSLAAQQTSLTVDRVDNRLKDLLKEIDLKVSRDVYESMMARLNDRLIRLEGGSQKFLTWVSVGISGCALLLTGLGMLGAIVLYMVNNHP